MLNRDFAPTQGLWNGVGGKMEEEETPKDCVVREVKEETGLDISSNNIVDKGTVSWDVDNKYSGGMYVFLVEVSEDLFYQTPKKVDEGILDWKKISWLLDNENFGVGEMIPYFLPTVLNTKGSLNHRCVLQNNKLTEYEYAELPQ